MPTTTEQFAKFLKEKYESSRFKTYTELANTAKVSKQNLSRILNQSPHTLTGKSPNITRETASKLAKALDWNESEALKLAGFVSAKDSAPELLEEARFLFDEEGQFTDEDKDDLRRILRQARLTVEDNRKRRENEDKK